MDIMLNVPNGEMSFDIALKNGDLVIDNGLETAVYISLFSWARAKDGDDVPQNSPKYGWWGDQVSDDTRHRTGSRLWLMLRRKLTQATISDAVQYCNEALAWLKADGVVSSMQITPETKPTGELDILIQMYRYGEQVIELRYSKLWDKWGENMGVDNNG